MHLSLARLVSMSVIFCLLPSSSIVIFVFYLFSISVNSIVRELRVCIQFTLHWFDASFWVTPVNNIIALISRVQWGVTFFAADSLCVVLQISGQFSPEKRTPSHWMPSSNQILTQSDHSRSFKVIRFGVNQKPLRGYIVQYDNCGLEYEGPEDIAVFALGTYRRDWLEEQRGWW